MNVDPSYGKQEHVGFACGGCHGVYSRNRDEVEDYRNHKADNLTPTALGIIGGVFGAPFAVAGTLLAFGFREIFKPGTECGFGYINDPRYNNLYDPFMGTNGAGWDDFEGYDPIADNAIDPMGTGGAGWDDFEGYDPITDNAIDPMGTGGAGWDDFEGYDHTGEDGGGGSGHDSDHDPRNGGKQSTSTDSDPNNDHREDGRH